MESNSENQFEDDTNEETSNRQWEDYEKVDEWEKKMKLSKNKIYQNQNRFINVNNLQTLLPAKSLKGLCGLQNLGNTCFMNSAIQCVSHSIDLTYFFLSREYAKEVNVNNKVGSKGKLAREWFGLLESLWMENSKYTSPSEFKHAIAKIARQFSGFGQQDSHELLTFLLDGLHEDLNKISVKPYKEIEEKGEDEEDEAAAKRFWDLHLLRNDSVIVDLFHGQYRSTITCPECHRVSITYDPFTTVPIPIPKLKRVDVYFVPQLNIKKVHKLSIFVSEAALFFDVAHYINSNIEEKIGKFRCMIVCNNECIKLAKASDNIIEAATKGFIFCCEVDPKLLMSDYQNFVVHIRDGVKGEFMSFPRMFTVTPSQTLKDFRKIIYGFVRRYIELPEKINQAVNNKFENLLKNFINNNSAQHDGYQEIVQEEFDVIFGDDSIKLDDEDLRKEIYEFRNKFPFKLYMKHSESNKKIDLFNVSSTDIRAELEKLSIDKTADQENLFTDNEPLEKIINLYKSNFKIILEFTGDDYINKDKVRSLKTCVNISAKEKTKQLNLNDCLEHFRLTEKLEKNNEWYCTNCKKHQQAFKKLELFYTPKLLVLHMKRFEYSQMGRYRTYAEKIGATIDFPLENLELKNYIVGPDSSNAQYELYAVSQHYGSCGGGHYTAICKNMGRWYDFNDSSVSPSSESNVVSSAAYLLFYRRKEE